MKRPSNRRRVCGKISVSSMQNVPELQYSHVADAQVEVIESMGSSESRIAHARLGRLYPDLLKAHEQLQGVNQELLQQWEYQRRLVDGRSAELHAVKAGNRWFRECIFSCVDKDNLSVLLEQKVHDSIDEWVEGIDKFMMEWFLGVCYSPILIYWFLR